MSRISLLLPEDEIKPRLRCNNKDILQVKLASIIPWQAKFVNQQR